MLKDIPQLKVTDIAVAIVPRAEKAAKDEVELWDAYLINLKKDTIFSVLVSMKGYDGKGKDKVETANFKVFIEEIPPDSYVKIEPIASNIFHLTNQYWVSFSEKNTLYDKKFIFVKGSIDPMNFTEIPLIQQQGVLIK